MAKTTCAALHPGLVGALHAPARACILNSGMERITDIGTLLSRFQENEEETMVTRFHGIDRHKKHSTVSVLDRDGRETRFLRSCQMEAYQTPRTHPCRGVVLPTRAS